ncbi:MAG TPA: translation initiation factor IF-3 [Spirochaetota bacterium]|nr:translation initiation factor IF-3 [Spirochaetota bacterium]HPY87492.1 translation initiation factor IF-3 [Spirochaetota bacterium]HQB60703.1 translation initiation factor IF-3 [Spirochaetota bacterium]
MSTKELRVNDQIRIKEILLIDQDGTNIGVTPIGQALEMAEEAGLDLVEISPNSKPPVCKIINYGKYKFELEKKAKEAKKNQQIIKLKEIRLQPKIDKHDYDFKLEHIKNFLTEGDKVKITIRFRGRQLAHMYLGEEVLKKYEEDLKEFGVIEKAPSVEGKNMSMIVAPLKKK